MNIEISECLTNAMNEIVNSEETSIRKLEKIIQLHIDITIRNPAELASLNADWMHLADEDLLYFLKMREEYEENFRKIVKKGIVDGEIKDLNSEVIIFSMLSTLLTLYIWWGKEKSLNAKVVKSNMIQILLNGIV